MDVVTLFIAYSGVLGAYAMTVEVIYAYKKLRTVAPPLFDRPLLSALVLLMRVAAVLIALSTFLHFFYVAWAALLLSGVVITSLAATLSRRMLRRVIEEIVGQ